MALGGVGRKEKPVDAARSRRIGPLELAPAAVLLVAAALAALSVALLAAQEPARATFPGANGNIAFLRPVDGTYQVFTVSPAGGNPTQLTFDKTLKESPAWSSDGRKIAFVRWGPRGRDIYTMNADGSEKVAITSSSKNDYQPAWSPSGQRLVFSRDVGKQPYSNYDLFTVSSDGSDVVRLTRTDELEDGPAWSPDGNTIAFSRRAPSRGGSIYTMKADGSEAPSEVGSVCCAEFVGGVDWSPDGQWLAYDSAGLHGSTIWKVRADGTQPTFLTTGSGLSPEPNASSPAWAPDGTEIAFSSSSLYKMDTDGNNVESIVEGVGWEPSWQPVP
jgi:Tol biopolymer transport system component